MKTSIFASHFLDQPSEVVDFCNAPGRGLYNNDEVGRYGLAHLANLVGELIRKSPGAYLLTENCG